jgi:hypothetical protein
MKTAEKGGSPNRTTGHRKLDLITPAFRGMTGCEPEKEALLNVPK